MYELRRIKAYHYQIIQEGETIADILKGSARRCPWHVLDGKKNLIVTDCKNPRQAMDRYFEKTIGTQKSPE